jgi:hypothetical protein
VQKRKRRCGSLALPNDAQGKQIEVLWDAEIGPRVIQEWFAASWGAWLKAAGLSEDTPTAQLKDSDSKSA